MYRTILKLLEGILEEILSLSKEEIKGPKKFQGTVTKWKCNKYAIPICKAQSNC